MRIVIVHSCFVLYWRGRLRAFAKTLRKRGDTLVIVETSKEVSCYDYASYENKCDIDAHFYNYCDDDNHDGKSKIKIPEWLCKVFDEIQPDVIIAAPIAFTEGATAVYWCSISNKKVIIMDDVRYEDVPRSKLNNFVKKVVYRNVDAMFIPALSHAYSYEKWGLDKHSLFYGLDVVDNEWFERKVESFRNSKSEPGFRVEVPSKYFLGIGRHIVEKNLTGLLDSYKAYRGRVPSPWGLVLIGDGPETPTLKMQVKKDEIEGVLFIGAISQEIICEYMAFASVCVLPSRSETWGLVVNEAMAAGLSVLVSKECGCSQSLVKEGVNGWTFPAMNNEKFTNLLVRYTDLEYKDLKEMGRKSKEIISEWSTERFAKGAIKAIEYCMNDSTPVHCSWFDRVVLNLWKCHC